MRPNGSPFIGGSKIKFNPLYHACIPAHFHGQVFDVILDSQGRQCVDVCGGYYLMESYSLAKFLGISNVLYTFDLFDDVSGSVQALTPGAVIGTMLANLQALKDLDNIDLGWTGLAETIIQHGAPKAINTPCTCSSRDLFHKGCQCGHMSRR